MTFGYEFFIIFVMFLNIDQYREVSIQFVLPFIFIVVIDIICNIVCDDWSLLIRFFWQSDQQKKKYRLAKILEDGMWQQILRKKYLGNKTFGQVLMFSSQQLTRKKKLKMRKKITTIVFMTTTTLKNIVVLYKICRLFIFCKLDMIFTLNHLRLTHTFIVFLYIEDFHICQLNRNAIYKIRIKNTIQPPRKLLTKKIYKHIIITKTQGNLFG
ncbi:hypothetical protein ACJX0J_032943, partial [Zea mays]